MEDAEANQPKHEVLPSMEEIAGDGTVGKALVKVNGILGSVSFACSMGTLAIKFLVPHAKSIDKKLESRKSKRDIVDVENPGFDPRFSQAEDENV